MKATEIVQWVNKEVQMLFFSSIAKEKQNKTTNTEQRST